MTAWDLSRIRYTVRKLTGKFDTSQLPDTSPGAGQVSVTTPPGIDDYINDFYLYDMPEHFRTLKLRDFFTFTTIPNCGTYSLPQYIYQVEPPIYIDNYQIAWYQSPDIFYQIWPELNFINAAITTTSASIGAGPYTFTLTQTPIQQGTVVIGLTPNPSSGINVMETFTDSDTPIPLDLPTQQNFTLTGTLTGNQGGTGTINYLTGAVSIKYNTAPPVGSNINAHYHPYVASRPRDIMFYQQQLFLRPIPNDAYAVKVMAYFTPAVVLNAATNSPQRAVFDTTNKAIQGFNGSVSLSDLPQYNEWWQMISYGAAIKILVEEGDYEEASKLKYIFEEQKLLAQRKALKQLANQRIQTSYAENGGGPAFPIFPIY